MSPYFPEIPPDGVVHRYHCPNCEEWYGHKHGEVTFACAVLHAAGTCCHVGETLVGPPPPMVDNKGLRISHHGTTGRAHGLEADGTIRVRGNT